MDEKYRRPMYGTASRTVEMLINELRGLPKDMYVFFQGEDDYFYPITSLEVADDKGDEPGVEVVVLSTELG